MEAANGGQSPTPPNQPVVANTAVTIPIPAPSDASPTSIKKSSFPKSIIVVIFITLLLFIFGLTAIYFFWVLPKLNTRKLIDEVKPSIANLKTSTKSVTAVIDKIHFITTEELKQPDTNPLQTSELLNPSQLAYSETNSSTLGISTRRNTSLIESVVWLFFQETTNALQNLRTSDKKVAGITTTREDVFTEKLRLLKDETLRTDEYLTKTQIDLAQLITKTATIKQRIPKSAKEKIITSSKIQEKAQPYFAEAKRIADYYKTISDILITMKTKISSFQVSLASTGLIFNSIEKDLDLQAMSSKMSQAQVFLDQAKKDTEEIKKLSETLSSMKMDTLPKASENYHQHNVKVLSTVTEYFASTSNLLQSMITATNATLGKAQLNHLTPGDSRMYIVVIIDINNAGQKADAKFISDFQSLLGEEATLTLSFWQNNTLASSGSLVEVEIDNYEKMLNRLYEANRVPLLTK